jgi:hypothetical protein
MGSQSGLKVASTKTTATATVTAWENVSQSLRINMENGIGDRSR